jgi:hypothetical protein
LALHFTRDNGIFLNFGFEVFTAVAIKNVASIIRVEEIMQVREGVRRYLTDYYSSEALKAPRKGGRHGNITERSARWGSGFENCSSGQTHNASSLIVGTPDGNIFPHSHYFFHPEDGDDTFLRNVGL